MSQHQRHYSLSPAAAVAAAPPPPPKPSAHSSGRGTPQSRPPPPPPPNPLLQAQQDGSQSASVAGATEHDPCRQPNQDPAGDAVQFPLPEEGWLPAVLNDKSTQDLQTILQDSTLQTALIQSRETTHVSLPASTAALQQLLAANLALADSLLALETHLQTQRQSTQSRLLSLRGLERQWRAKQAEQDAALRDFSPPALYQRLSAAVGEQEALCRSLEESFLEGDGGAGGDGGVATEREVADFVKRIRESRKIAYLRRERKERWDEGRVGGWR